MSGFARLVALVSPSWAAFEHAHRVRAEAEEGHTLAAADLVGVPWEVVLWVQSSRSWGFAEIRRRLLVGEGSGWVKQWKEQQ